MLQDIVAIPGFGVLAVFLYFSVGRVAVRQRRAAMALLPADDPRLPALRHRVAAALVKSGRYAEAPAEFRLIGRWAGGAPWRDVRDVDRWRGFAALSAPRNS